MQHLKKALAAAALLTLAACGTAPKSEQPPPAGAAAPAIADASDGNETLTGSRIPKRGGGDRAVKTIGAREARNTLDSIPKPFDSR